MVRGSLNAIPDDHSLRLRANVPNVVTAARVVLAVIIGYLLHSGDRSSIAHAGILLIVAGSTDTLDGFLSRRLDQATPGGALFDVVADELLFMPSLILAVSAGLFARTDGLVPWNPYLYAVPALAGGVSVLAGVAVFLWKRRTRFLEFPSPPPVAKANYWFWMAPLIVAVLGVGPNLLLAVLMYLAFISTILTFYAYLKKGGYVFTD
jgi:phosphatidylglycerophosphate synthase